MKLQGSSSHSPTRNTSELLNNADNIGLATLTPLFSELTGLFNKTCNLFKRFFFMGKSGLKFLKSSEAAELSIW